MRYISTRGQAEVLDFENVLLAGLASDGGLYVPEKLPHWDRHFLNSLHGMNYEEIALEVLSPFVEDCFDRSTLTELISTTYRDFTHITRAPLKQIGDDLWLCELFHGPTLAFKDFAMQLIGNMYQRVLARRNRRLTIIGATSGDTGSAAIEAFKGIENVDVFILFPKGRVSEVQQRQMTTSAAANVFPIALQGNFDDCQALVKKSFNDQEFRNEISLGGVNSINWGRVMAQMVYYVTTSVALGAPSREISFSVPTGNFGDIFAGYLTKKMGLPIDQLIVATNQNDILHRTVESGQHWKGDVKASISPSMDIQISSNFERLLFDLYGQNSQEVVALMKALETEGGFDLSHEALNRLTQNFQSAKTSEAQTKSEITRMYRECKELVCPHTAVGIHSARERKNEFSPMVVLATAHPAKFPQAVESATGVYPELPPHLQDIFDREEKFEVLENDFSVLKKYVREKCQ